MEPAEGERRAIVGFSAQYRLAAEVVYRGLGNLEWICVADPEAGAADDFQFKCGATRHAMQVKWSQYPGMFGWAGLTNPSGNSPALIASLAAAWSRIRRTWNGPLRIHLCSNELPSSNVSTAAGNPLKTATTRAPKHFAAFLEASFRPIQSALLSQRCDLTTLRTWTEYAEWFDAWESLRESSQLGDDDFVRFLTEFVIEFGISTTTPIPSDSRREADINALAQCIQDYVADPSRPIQIERASLIDRLGWRDRLQYRHRHQFPIPATYVTNQMAQQAIDTALAEIKGGYLAVVGPAGSGKSTLLSDMLFRGRVIRYYAFVPDAPDPLSGRGEAEYFLSDLSLALQESGIGRVTQPTGLVNLQRTVHDQLAAAGDFWTTSGERTLIILDGLDNVPREQQPVRSMLDELPAPAALSDGVYILIGSQSTHILPASIQAALLDDSRRVVDAPPMTIGEVRAVIEKSPAGSAASPGLLDSLAATCGGHPLALTYLVQEIVRICESTLADDAARERQLRELLESADAFRGNVDDRYRGYFKAVSDSREVIELLGAVARLRIPIQIDWLRTWAGPAAVSDFVTKASPYFWRQGGHWAFIHNSFRRFLLDETVRVGGAPQSDLDEQFHRKLADHCAASGLEWAMYRDEEVVHRYLAKQHDRVVSIASPARLRAALEDLETLPRVIDHAELALRSAAEADDRRAFVALFILLGDLRQRSQTLTAEQVGSTMVRVLSPHLALSYVVRGGQLQIATPEALGIAAVWGTAGHRDASSAVIKAVHGLPGVLANESGHAKSAQMLGDWAEATMSTSDLDTVLSQLNRHLPIAPPAHERSSINVDPSARHANHEHDWQRLEVLSRCFEVLLEVRDRAGVDRVMDLMDAEAPPDWQGWARIERASAALADGLAQDSVKWIDQFIAINDAGKVTASGDEKSNETDSAATASVDPVADEGREHLPLDLRLRAALVLLQTGHAEESKLERIVSWGEIPDEGNDYESNLWEQQSGDRLCFLVNAVRLEIRKRDGIDDSGSSPGIERHYADPARRRFALASDALTRIRAADIAFRIGLTTTRPHVAALADSIIRVHEVPSATSRNWTGWYRIRESMRGLIESLIQLSHFVGGAVELSRLSDKFDEAWSGDRRRYWNVELRQHVLACYASLDPTSHEWVEARLAEAESELADAGFEPSQHVELWLRQAEISSAIGLVDGARQSVANAVVAAGRIGYSRANDQLSQWITWLRSALDAGSIDQNEFIANAEAFASRCCAAAEVDNEGASEAAQQLIANVWRISPRKSLQLGDALCEQGVLDEALLIQSVALAALRDEECELTLPLRFTTKLVLPITKYPSADLRLAVIARQNPDALREFDAAADLWAVDAPDRDRRSPESEDGSAAVDASDPENRSRLAARVTSPRSLLTILRGLNVSESPSRAFWDTACSAVLGSAMPPQIARALIDEAERLSAPDETIGLLAQSVADGGDIEFAVRSLQERLSRLPAHQWFGDYSDGARRKLFESSLSSRHPDLVRLAIHDLARAVTSEKSYWRAFSPDTRSILELTVGPESVASAWGEVNRYLDTYAPVSDSLVLVPLGTRTAELPDTSSAALGAMCGYLFGHPTKAVDEGARRAVMEALAIDRITTEAVLIDALSGNDWEVEAALHAIAAGASESSLSAVLIEAIGEKAASNDAIVRDLARIVASQHGFTVGELPKRELAPAYRIATPPRPTRTKPPEVDREGIPFVDLDDPQQVVAPNDFAIRLVAPGVGLDSSAVLFRASQLAQRATGNKWTDTGVRGMAARLKRRGQFHRYRPWAYMAGRRAVAQVLAELEDAFPADLPSNLAAGLEMVAPQLIRIEPEGLARTEPGPWRPADVDLFSTASWCDEVTDAAPIYAARLAENDDGFVLAECSEWQSLAWGSPIERREISTTHGIPNSSLEIPSSLEGWESVRSASRYPRLAYRWLDRQLVVQGFEALSDAPFLNWWAVHPAVAKLLGWLPDSEPLFRWRGADGVLRAETKYFARGLMSHQPPGTGWCAYVWQVILTKKGREEVRSAFPNLRRTLTVSRTLPESRRDNQPEQNAVTSLTL